MSNIITISTRAIAGLSPEPEARHLDDGFCKDAISPVKVVVLFPRYGPFVA